MLKTGLEFAPGTTDDCKRMVGGLFQPGEILGAYRQARAKFGHGDVVLVAAEWDASGFEVMPRLEYVKRIREAMGAKAPAILSVLTIASRSAHAIVRLPFTAEAVWLIVNRRGMVPVMTVLYATPYEVAGDQSPQPTLS